MPDEKAPWCSCCRRLRAREGDNELRLRGSARGVDIASGTLLQRNHQIAGKLCDYIIRRRVPGVPALICCELKSRASHVESIVSQLQGGANLIHSNDRGDFMSVLVHGRGISTHELRILGRKRVSFRGKKYPISVVRSGSYV